MINPTLHAVISGAATAANVKRTTLIAAERTNRRASVIELDPTYVDVSIERWQRLTGGTALHADSGKPFQQPEGILAANTGEGGCDGEA